MLKSVAEKQLQINNRNYNSNDRLSTVKNEKYSYSRFDISTSNFTSFNAGLCIPILVLETLPSDIIKIKLDGVIRMSSPASNTMVNPVISINFFYINNQNLWKNWIYFFGESKTAGYSPEIKNLPKLKVNLSSFEYTENDLGSYLGLPINQNFSVKTDKIVVNSILPFMLYCKFWNDWYRDQNLDSEAIYNAEIDSDLVLDDSIDLSDYHESCLYGKGLLPSSKLPDYFTTCLPWTQKGDSIVINNLPLNNIRVNGSIVNDENKELLFSPKWLLNNGKLVDDKAANGNLISGNSNSTYFNSISASWQSTDEANLSLKISDNATLSLKDNTQLYTISDLRDSITLQHYLELNARFGTRYNEYLFAHWGILIDPLDIGKSIMIGGWEDSLKISSVVQTSETSNNSPLGSISGVLQNYFKMDSEVEYASKDHGFIMAIATVRSPLYYSNNLSRMFSRENKFDYYDPLFANISDQPVYNEEIYLKISSDTKYNENVFGYNESWAHYRYNINKVSGFLNPDSNNSLFNLYLFGEKYADTPKLGIEWMKYSSDIINNSLFKVEGNNEFYHQFIANFNFNIIADRLIPLYGVPGVNKI